MIAKQQIEIENLKAALSNGNKFIRTSEAIVKCSGCDHAHVGPYVCNPRHLKEKTNAVIYTKKWNWCAFEYDHYRDGELMQKNPVF